MDQNPTRADFIHLHFVVLVWGFTAILGQLITLPPVEMVFYRTLLAALGIWVYAKWKKKPLLYDSATIIKLILIGFLVAAHWILFFLSARLATISVCLVGIATTAFWTSILEPLLTRRRFQWVEVALGLSVISGIYIILYYEFEIALGLLVAILSAIIASIFTILNSKMVKNTNPFAVAFYEMSGATVAIVFFFPVYAYQFSDGLELRLSGLDWLYVCLLAFVCTDYAYTAAVHLMKRISAYSVNLTVNLEPVYGILLAVLIFKDEEVLTLQFYIGACIIILSVLLHPVLNKMLFNMRRQRAGNGRDIAQNSDLL